MFTELAARFCCPNAMRRCCFGGMRRAFASPYGSGDFVSTAWVHTYIQRSVAQCFLLPEPCVAGGDYTWLGQKTNVCSTGEACVVLYQFPPVFFWQFHQPACCMLCLAGMSMSCGVVLCAQHSVAAGPRPAGLPHAQAEAWFRAGQCLFVQLEGLAASIPAAYWKPLHTQARCGVCRQFLPVVPASMETCTTVIAC